VIVFLGEGSPDFSQVLLAGKETLAYEQTYSLRWTFASPTFGLARTFALATENSLFETVKTDLDFLQVLVTHRTSVLIFFLYSLHFKG
jgi:hypothetical protein